MGRYNSVIASLSPSIRKASKYAQLDEELHEFGRPTPTLEISKGRAAEYSRSTTTKHLCLCGLVFAYVAAIACIVGGSRASGYSSDSPANHCMKFSHTVRAVIPLGINFIILVLTESLGFIHAASLKWALFREGALEYNSNLRLFTFSRTSMPNNICFNTIYLVAIALCYASSPLIIIGVDLEDPQATKCFSKTGPITLGISLLVQALICTWCLWSTSIPTWSSSPAVAAAVALTEDNLRQPGQCMVSVHDVGGKGPRIPKYIQGSAYQTKKQIIWVLYLVFAAVIAFFLWGISMIAITLSNLKHYNSQHLISNWALLPVYGNYNDIAYFLPYNARVTPSALLQWFANGEAGLFEVLLFTGMVQAVLTIGTHCAELQVSMARDEATWRAAATSQSGLHSELSPLRTVFTSWQTLVLLAFKPVIHWFYGLAMTVDWSNGLWMLAPQIIYLVILWVLFIIFVLFVSYHKPKGPIPATYGHIQTLVNLIDEWSPQMYWGEKSGPSYSLDGTAVYHAGTSSNRLPPVHMNRWYE